MMYVNFFANPNNVINEYPTDTELKFNMDLDNLIEHSDISFNTLLDIIKLVNYTDVTKCIKFIELYAKVHDKQ